jgi:hypothetical protein
MTLNTIFSSSEMLEVNCNNSSNLYRNKGPRPRSGSVKIDVDNRRYGRHEESNMPDIIRFTNANIYTNQTSATLLATCSSESSSPSHLTIADDVFNSLHKSHSIEKLCKDVNKNTYQPAKFKQYNLKSNNRAFSAHTNLYKYNSEQSLSSMLNFSPSSTGANGYVSYCSGGTSSSNSSSSSSRCSSNKMASSQHLDCGNEIRDSPNNIVRDFSNKTINYSNNEREHSHIGYFTELKEAISHCNRLNQVGNLPPPLPLPPAIRDAQPRASRWAVKTPTMIRSNHSNINVSSFLPKPPSCLNIGRPPARVCMQPTYRHKSSDCFASHANSCINNSYNFRDFDTRNFNKQSHHLGHVKITKSPLAKKLASIESVRLNFTDEQYDEFKQLFKVRLMLVLKEFILSVAAFWRFDKIRFKEMRLSRLKLVMICLVLFDLV